MKKPQDSPRVTRSKDKVIQFAHWNQKYRDPCVRG
uniref:Uncharacterized protein n=1 Tax=Anguilla anguilla TaxID=7936 RepID=A0A0E9X8G4_ANGAN